MNLFVTGGSGFIGSHLQQHLAAGSDARVFAPKSGELNLTDEGAVDDFIRRNKIDVIIHLANRGGGRDTLDMKNVTEYNLRIFFNIVRQKSKVAKIISFGSGAEYGKHKPIVNARESNYERAFPLDEYGFYKAVASHYIELCDNVAQLRLFGVYGEYENYRYKFITNAIVKNLLHLPITINQNVFFDYIYIDDLLNIIDFFIAYDAKNKIYNASSGVKTDLIALAESINDVSDFKSEIIVLNEGLNNEYTSNNDLLKSEMGDKFRLTPHREAIGKIYKYFRENLKNLDIETIKQDPYLGKINEIWKGKK